MNASPTVIKKQFDAMIRAEYVSPLDWLIDLSQGGDDMRFRRRMLEVAETGAVVPAYIIQANDGIWSPGVAPGLPALVLISFDSRVMSDRKYMVGLVSRLTQLKGTNQSDHDLSYAANIVTDERAHRDRRQMLPPSMTGGPIVYAADIILYRARLENGYLDTDELTCIAEPGTPGRIELVPWWIAGGSPVDFVVESFWSRLASRSSIATALLVTITLTAALVTSKALPTSAQSADSPATAGNAAPAQQAPPTYVPVEPGQSGAQTSPGVQPQHQPTTGAAAQPTTAAPVVAQSEPPFDPTHQRILYVSPEELREMEGPSRPPGFRNWNGEPNNPVVGQSAPDSTHPIRVVVTYANPITPDADQSSSENPGDQTVSPGNQGEVSADGSPAAVPQQQAPQNGAPSDAGAQQPTTQNDASAPGQTVPPGGAAPYGTIQNTGQ